MQLLQDAERGEFIFRPSSKGPNNLTLTWKFYTDNVVHIDIQEHDKAPGASIGSKLQISSNEFFENLQEIVERYIHPCNKFLFEAISHVKFIEGCKTVEDLETHLKQEKLADPQRIPYKLTILPAYPQHIVLGYIPKTSLVKEFIKVSYFLS
jgi:transcription elongation factor SPT6